MKCQEPRPVAVESHQYYVEGLLHGIFRDDHDRPLALIEYKSGNLERLYLDGVYSIKFKDKTP